jgi:hypothetical protein
MADVVYKQSLEVIVGKNPDGGGSIIEKDFVLSPPEVLVLANLNEDSASRFVIPDGTVDQPICTGTVESIRVLLVKPDANIDLKLINSNGTSQNITFVGGCWSVLHVQLTGILVSNTSGSPIKGRILTVGD